MALHTNLPIYKVAYNLFDTSVSLVKNMPRDFKQAIGARLRDECLAIVVLVFRANVAQNKTPHLSELIERLQVTELLLRLSCDKQLISKTQYAQAVELTGSVGKQAAGWRRSATSLAS